ncbi:YciI family protein [Dyella japonica]|uniref:YCII-related domain-containing protein n=1 Tax=Dyella japonica A8 TaxID=1217721 RepID=A0A075K1J9_9GAMM|nr:hypothetical protein [Dyella japonica]AIF46113.1 hypothetical protein HY57_02010 [Dyella japonica A8]
MFLILLRFSDNKASATDHMSGHKEWIRQGVDVGTFVLVGSIRPGVGGAVIATGTERHLIEQRVAEDPFVIHNVVVAEILDIEPSVTDARLAFLAG